MQFRQTTEAREPSTGIRTLPNCKTKSLGIHFQTAEGAKRLDGGEMIRLPPGGLPGVKMQGKCCPRV